ncbi:D-psicose 3-epimerase [Sporosarcina obsidiansis]|uniref:D-psicose 3-epimerase n=1 Tax=Sporosarcina obsidiansis TaxID=2660748 RepID=UPI00129BCA04|nr:sugar phosphate isomerase/epimerase family protein [Sporosarcina obsidiansis]
MKYGVYFAYWEQSWETDFSKYIQKASELGFDILEVAALGLINLTDEELKRLHELSVKHNIILTAGIGLPKEYDVSSDVSTTRQKGIDFMKHVLDCMHKAGIDRIGGTVYSYWPVDYNTKMNKESMRRHSIDSIQILADYAQKYNITLLIETLNRFEQILLNDAKEAVDYVNEINRENVKVMLDTFHMNIEEDNIADAIRYTGSHLGHLHIGEANRKVPGKGSLPWEEIGLALNEINYSKYVVMEPFVKMGGQVGEDIKIWRDLSNSATEQQLDAELKDSLQFIKNLFEN